MFGGSCTNTSRGNRTTSTDPGGRTTCHYSGGGGGSRSGGYAGSKGGSGSSSRSSSGKGPSSPSAADRARDQESRNVIAEAGTLAIPGAALVPGRMPMNLSVAGVGTVPMSEGIAASMLAGLRASVAALGGLARSVVSATPMGMVIASIAYTPKVGVGSDQVPGRTPENFFAMAVPAQAVNLPDKGQLQRIAQESGKVNMDVRGVLTAEQDVKVHVVRTPTAEPVNVVRAAKDERTGLYVHSLPESGVPNGRLVTTPPTSVVPNSPPLVSPIPDVPVTVHTGGDVNAPVAPPATEFPISGGSSIRDTVVVYPEDAGLEPIYVMFNTPRKGVKPSGHDYHQAPKTEDITGFPGLIKRPPKTPKQGGAGKRARWADPKGKTIYEWDSKKGELEAYRASNDIT
ncbi:uncharacterized protein LOC105695798 [Orussus abietinus]|uniref:uncharacterized protein LOC105695798 n=1 Tax=Orussus abietinus TaxID=222816 RepID=UPI000626162E|nr:uncharacterized protein LOC105695798 [Orussus abietinus]